MAEDTKLAQTVLEAFVEEPRVSAQPIHVAVKEGEVLLSGTVQSYRQKLAAQEVASAIAGVRRVTNEIDVEPSKPPEDEQLAECVRGALDAKRAITQEAIGVSVKDGTVTLTGTVGSDRERALADDVASACSGVREVKNHLIVDVLETVEDKDLVQRLCSVLADTLELQNVEIGVEVSHQSAILSGEVPELWQKDLAESVIRNAGVVHVRNDILVKPSGSSTLE